MDDSRVRKTYDPPLSGFTYNGRCPRTASHATVGSSNFSSPLPKGTPMSKICTRATAILGLDGEGLSQKHAARRQALPRRYAFLESSSMSRAMDRL